MAKPYFNFISPTQTQIKIDITSECMQALHLEPKARSESDIKLLMELIGNFPQISQAPILIRHELGTYMKLDEDSVLYRNGDPADSIYVILKGLIKEKVNKDSYGDYEGSVFSVGDGTIIGEQMILLNKIHNATAVAAEETDLIKLSIEDYAQMRRTHEHDVSDKLSLLTSLPLFKSYDTSELSPLCDSLLLKSFIPNKVIVEQGSEPTGVYFIKSGKCKMVKEMDVRPTVSQPKSPASSRIPPPTSKKSPQKKLSSSSPSSSSSSSSSLSSSSPSSPSSSSSSSSSHSSPFSLSSSSRPVPSSSNSNIAIHPFLASRLDPNYSKNNNNNNNNNNSTLSSSTTKNSSSSSSTKNSLSSSSSPTSSPTKSRHSPSTTRKSSSPSKISSLSSPSSPSSSSSSSTTTTTTTTTTSSSENVLSSPNTKKPETEKRFLEVGPLLPYEYFGEKAIIENRSGVEMSVLSETHVDLYYLPKIDFHRYINSKTISFMKKNAASYPSDKEILAQYYKQQEWERYKSNLVQDILNEKANRNMGSMFSRTR